MRALVTGAGGFLGSYVAKALIARGDSVRTLCRGTYSELEEMGVEMFRVDLSRMEEQENRENLARACEGVEAVFHVAAISGIGEPWER